MKKFIFVLVGFMITTPVFAGSISGTAAFSGTAPEMEQISMDADPTCLAANAGPVYTESVVVNDNGTLRNVFVHIKEGVTGGAVPKDPVVIDQKGCRYEPHVFGIQVGQALQIVNSDATLHNVHSLAENSKQFNLGMPIQGMKLKKKFDSTEVMVKLKCDVHPWMSAYIGVLTHSHFGVSGNDGSFSISDLPAGDYVVEAWHEQYGTQTQNVTVGDGDTAVEFTFGI
jgi:plastocyanin